MSLTFQNNFLSNSLQRSTLENQKNKLKFSAHVSLTVFDKKYIYNYSYFIFIFPQLLYFFYTD